MRKICCLLFAFVVIQAAVAQSLDYQLMREINVEDRDHHLDNTFKFISNSSEYISAGTPVAILVAGIFSNNKKLVKQGEDAVISYAISSIATYSLKNAIRRERPFERHKDIIKLSNGGGMSFPSGHTSAAFSVATAIAMDNKQWYIRVPVLVWASLVGYSRVDLGVHYPSDVLAGAIVGAGSAFAGRKINGWLNRQKSVHHALALL